MSTNHNCYSAFKALDSNKGATAAAIDIVTSACKGSSGATHTTQVLEWAIDGENFKKLRDKIKECATES